MKHWSFCTYNDLLEVQTVFYLIVSINKLPYDTSSLHECLSKRETSLHRVNKRIWSIEKRYVSVA